MMELNHVYSNIMQMYNCHREDYGIMNPRFIKNEHYQITWINYLGIERFETYEEYYFWAYENVQYSFSLQDDSLIQIFYKAEKQGKKEVVVEGSMAYLPSPYKYCDYFRFDIDTNNEESFRHTSYHAHFGYRSKDVRFTLVRYPMPSEFVKLVMNLCYGVHIGGFSSDKFWESLDDRGINYNHYINFCDNA